MPVKSRTRISVAFFDSAARTAISHGASVDVTCGDFKAFRWYTLCSYRTTIEIMRSKLAVLFLAGLLPVFAQTPGDREFSRAQSNVEELRKQVAEGVIPRARLEQAEESLADARDAEL